MNAHTLILTRRDPSVRTAARTSSPLVDARCSCGQWQSEKRTREAAREEHGEHIEAVIGVSQ